MSSNNTPGGNLTVTEVQRLIDDAFPQINAGGRSMVIEAVGPDFARVRLLVSERNTRPGGTVSGPAMFTLADFSIYVALIARLGAAAIPAVTSNLNITFLSRPAPCDVVAEVQLVRVGKRLAYADVSLRSVGGSDVIAHATGSYALPSVRSG